MRILTLNDGTEYELDWCHGDKGILNINIVSGASIVELATKFSNPEATSHIHATFGDTTFDQDYDGYTELYSISIDSWKTGTTLITLMKPDRIAQVA